MPYEIFLPDFFKSIVKDLKKKYPNVIQDLKTALRVVESNPELGRTLRGFPDVKKLRVQNSDVTKGKSGGYRLIYLVDHSPMLNIPLRLYYPAKRFLPRRLQLALRRPLVAYKLRKHGALWPINPATATPPPGWTGWPDGKRFALVLTHDVESQRGVDRVLKLAALEESLGFRSSFNFVAEDYAVPSSLRAELEQRGFEVGIHGLTHDGTLYHSRSEFLRQAARINQVLRDWKVAGFRSPCMYHNLEWLHDLDIEYDASTFDIDPFEPQPDALGTIFPLFIPNPGVGGGYVELPYTLPQDLHLFVLMQENSIDIWKKKLRWLVENGGLVLVTTHPDYMYFGDGAPACDEYPVERYVEFLEHLVQTYDGAFWQALPKSVARFCSSISSSRAILSQVQPCGTSIKTATPIERWLQKGKKSGDEVALSIDSSTTSVKKKPRALFIYYMKFFNSALLYREAKAVKEAGYLVDIVCLRQTKDEKVVQHFDGLSLFCIQSRPTSEKQALLYFYHLAMFFLKSLMTVSLLGLVRRYSVVHITAPPDAMVFTAVLPKLLGARVLLDIHDIGPELYMRKLTAAESSPPIRLLKFLERVSCSFADHVIVVTQPWKERLVGRSVPEAKCTVLLNVPDEALFTAPSTRRTNGSTFSLFYHGSLEEHFGVDTLLAAVPEIARHIPHLQLHIYGAGRLQSEFQTLAASLGVNGIVRFHGSVPFHTLPRILPDADVGIVPTKGSVFSDEAVSMKSLEYISMDIPIVISATKAHRYLYDEATVKFFEPENAGELARAVISLYRDPAAREGLISAGRRFMAEHGWNESSKKYLRIIQGDGQSC